MKSFAELMRIDGRVALITGATGYLGSTMARALVELGATVILVDRPGSEFEPLKASLSRGATDATWSVQTDLESEQDRTDLVATVQKTHPVLDILVNNAAFVGTSDLTGWGEPLERQSVETWRRAIEVNLTAPFQLSQQLAPLLRKSKGASIINIGSIYGQYGPDWGLYDGTKMSNPAAYAASKGGLLQLTRWLATTLAPDVRVNAISPGGVFRNQPEAFVRRYEARTPLHRMATEEDFVGAVGFLATDLSRYVTGQVIGVDGGWGVW